jgi:Pyruvate/2-oxoacid:ferredoxin oxidoreductase delta subunit
MTVRIGADCTACGLCLLSCPERALLRAPGRPAVVDDRCTGCLACIEVCPRDCITEVTGLAEPTEVAGAPA